MHPEISIDGRLDSAAGYHLIAVALHGVHTIHGCLYQAEAEAVAVLYINFLNGVGTFRLSCTGFRVSCFHIGLGSILHIAHIECHLHALFSLRIALIGQILVGARDDHEQDCERQRLHGNAEWGIFIPFCFHTSVFQ